MTRILYVSTSTSLGGAEKSIYLLASRLNADRFKTAGVVSLKPKGEYAIKLESAGFPALSLNLKSMLHASAVRNLAEIVARERPDIVHAVMYQAIQLCRVVKRWRGGFALVSSPRVNYRTRSSVSLWLDRILKSSDDMMICESDASRNFLIRQLGYKTSKTMTIHNGIDIIPPPDPQVRMRVRQELSVSADEILLGTVGRLDRQKGHAYLLEAIAKLRVLHPVRGLIIGDGPLLSELKDLAKTLKIAASVQFVGKQEDIVPWYAAMDIFVLPSLWEGFPNALLEAMSFSLPVAATHVDGIPELINHNHNGLLCRPENSQALFSAIQEYIVRPDFSRKMGSEGQRTVSQHFRLDNMIRTYEAAYTEIARKSAA